MRPFILILLLVLLVGGGFFLMRERQGGGQETPTPTVTPTSTGFADDSVVLFEPLPEQHGITSPLVIKGKARGTWFFEASFPVMLTDWDGRIIAHHFCQAEGEWMTTEFVGFECTLAFETPQDIGDFSDRGTLILQKDNPSGLPEHDDAREITVYFR